MEEFLKHEIEDLKELAADPTLESCCRRDLEDQLRVVKAKAQLAPQDRTQTRQRLARAVLRQTEDSDIEQEESDSEELEALRALRLQELKEQVRTRSMLHSEGHGTLTTVAHTKLHTIIKESVAEYIVCHFVIEGDDLGQSIDQRLESLACQFLATRFLRCPVRPGSAVPRNFGLLSSPPGLVVFFQGTIIATCDVLNLDCGDDIEAEDAVENWLRKKKCLVLLGNNASAGGSCPALGASAGSDDESEADEDEDGNEWQRPCEECGRRYPHQHIRSMCSGNAGKDTDSDNASDS